jgi:hypothetical protein
MQVVEITKGSKVKYELDKKTGLIKVMLCSQCLLHLYDHFLSQKTVWHKQHVFLVLVQCTMRIDHHNITFVIVLHNLSG